MTKCFQNNTLQFNHQNGFFCLFVCFKQSNISFWTDGQSFHLLCGTKEKLQLKCSELQVPTSKRRLKAVLSSFISKGIHSPAAQFSLVFQKQIVSPRFQWNGTFLIHTGTVIISSYQLRILKWITQLSRVIG